MNSGLTPDTDQTVINLAHAFDGYACTRQVWNTPEEEVHTVLGQRMMQVQQSGRLFQKAEDNFATNFYLHRTFHHWGWLLSVKSAKWYDMLFYYLHLYRLPIPEAHRHTTMHQGWARRPKGTAEAAAAEIRQTIRRG